MGFHITWHKWFFREGNVSHAKSRSVPQRSRSRNIIKGKKDEPFLSITTSVRITKYGVRVHLGMVECYILFIGQCDLDLDLWLQLHKIHVMSISSTSNQLGSPNIVFEYITDAKMLHNCVISYYFQPNLL